MCGDGGGAQVVRSPQRIWGITNCRYWDISWIDFPRKRALTNHWSVKRWRRCCCQPLCLIVSSHRHHKDVTVCGRWMVWDGCCVGVGAAPVHGVCWRCCCSHRLFSRMSMAVVGNTVRHQFFSVSSLAIMVSLLEAAIPPWNHSSSYYPGKTIMQGSRDPTAEKSFGRRSEKKERRRRMKRIPNIILYERLQRPWRCFGAKLIDEVTPLTLRTNLANLWLYYVEVVTLSYCTTTARDSWC